MTAGSALYGRILAFDYGDADRTELMEKVWSVTPWAVNVMTGNIEGEDYRRVREWCRDNLGAEAWPIHGRPGCWQFGSATVHGETFIGFETEEMLAQFQRQFGDLIIPDRPKAA